LGELLLVTAGVEEMALLRQNPKRRLRVTANMVGVVKPDLMRLRQNPMPKLRG
jgi:hypothetical protein